MQIVNLRRVLRIFEVQNVESFSLDPTGLARDVSSLIYGVCYEFSSFKRPKIFSLTDGARDDVRFCSNGARQMEHDFFGNFTAHEDGRIEVWLKIFYYSSEVQSANFRCILRSFDVKNSHFFSLAPSALAMVFGTVQLGCAK